VSRAGAETRERVVQSAKERMRRQGVAATSMLDAIADAGASRGSLYHYFPGGKAELIDNATRAACDEYSAAFALMETMTADEAVPAMLAFWREQVESTNFEAGCPVAAAALSGDEATAARQRAGGGFATWTESIERMLLNSGVPTDRASALAALILAAIEGAVVVSLARRSTAPMETVAAELLIVVRTAAQANMS
jgi:TetR/AcrR family transcriptional regulator, lmrAB and yxaGH operons repressor